MLLRSRTKVDPVVSDPTAVDAYIAELFESHSPTTIMSEIELYNLYRDYIKHEDGLLGSRLGSFLTMNTFLIAASVVIIGGISQTVLKSSLASARADTVIFVGIVIHTMIAMTGYRAATLTAVSIQAATDALGYLRDKGNHRLKDAISRGDLPFVTAGRGLPPEKRTELDQGTGIMREIPSMMKTVWFFIGLIPLPLLFLVMAGLLGWYDWDLATAPPVR